MGANSEDDKRIEILRELDKLRAVPDESGDPESKPTITIAERQSDSPPCDDSRPTITIAERDGSE